MHLYKTILSFFRVFLSQLLRELKQWLILREFIKGGFVFEIK